jgi:hypothetical protein
VLVVTIDKGSEVIKGVSNRPMAEVSCGLAQKAAGHRVFLGGVPQGEDTAFAAGLVLQLVKDHVPRLPSGF